MDWVVDLFTGDSIAHAVLILSLVAAIGIALGNVHIYGIGLGIAGVLFAGILFGHFKFTINHEILEFAREFGLILFVFTIGLQVGPGFFSSLRKQGLPLNIMAIAIVLMGVLITIAIFYFAGIPMPVAVGLFSGGTTNTPSLAAAQQALADMPNLPDDASKLPGLGYAVAYPFGVIGIILTMILTRLLFRIDPVRESEALERLRRQQAAPLTTVNLEVQNRNLDGVPLSKVPVLSDGAVVVSRILRHNEVQVAQPDTILRLNDVLLAVGPPERLEEIRLIIGSESNVNLKEVPSDIAARRVRVTQNGVLGKTLEELNFQGRYNVTVTRVGRMSMEFPAAPSFPLQFADTVTVVGREDDVNKVTRELGDSTEQLNHPRVISVFVGIALGVMVGSIPVHLPGVPAAVKLGLAGGPLLVAIVLSRIGRIGPLIWHMPHNANLMLREVGIVLFLACVGLKSGDQFVPTLLQGDGFKWMGLAAIITFVPIAIVALIARAIYKINFPTLCGVLAGSMTDPPALAFANTITKSSAPSLSYATVYPLVMLLRVVSAQILVLFFAR